MRLLKSNLAQTQQLNEATLGIQRQAFSQMIATLVLDYYLLAQQKELLDTQITELAFTMQRTSYLVQAGKILPEDVDLLTIEETKLSNQRENLNYTKQSLITQLRFHLGSGTDLETIQNLPLDTWEITPLDRDSLLKIAQQNPERIRSLQSTELAKQNVVRHRQNSGLSASVDVSFGYNQRAANLDGIYQNPLDRQMGTVSINLPILDGGKAKYNQLLAKNGLEQAELQETITQQKLLAQVENWVNQSRQTQNDIRYAEQSISLAKNRAVRTANLYAAGKATIDQYLKAQQYYTQLVFELNNARVRYWKMRYSIM